MNEKTVHNEGVSDEISYRICSDIETILGPWIDLENARNDDRTEPLENTQKKTRQNSDKPTKDASVYVWETGKNTGESLDAEEASIDNEELIFSSAQTADPDSNQQDIQKQRILNMGFLQFNENFLGKILVIPNSGSEKRNLFTRNGVNVEFERNPQPNHQDSVYYSAFQYLYQHEDTSNEYLINCVSKGENKRDLNGLFNVKIPENFSF